MGVVIDQIKEKFYRFQRKEPPFPSTEVVPAEVSLGRLTTFLNDLRDEQFLWGRPRFTNEGRVGSFHLFGQLTPRHAVCGYEPKRDSITINEAVTFEVACTRADDALTDFCSRCRKWVDRTGIGYEAITSNDVPDRQLSV
jgi:hypothetical protein